MEHDKFSYIAHKKHKFCNPIGERKTERMLNLVQLKNNDKVIDIGAGKCEALIRLIEKYNVTATGIDISERFIEEARSNSINRINSDRLNLIKGNVQSIISDCPDASYDLGICIGSTHALGGFENTIRELKKCVKAGGYIIIGECYWKSKPSNEYLTELGAKESDYKTHYGNIKAAEELDLISLWSLVASDENMNAYTLCQLKTIVMRILTIAIVRKCYKELETGEKRILLWVEIC